MSLLSNRRVLAVAMLMLFVPALTGAKENGCAPTVPIGGDTPPDGGGEPGACVVSGCSSQICADEAMASTCEWREEYACYQRLGICERDASGRCGWRETPELKACLAGGGEPTDPAPCRPTGCSSEICSDRDVASDCVYREEYACYQKLGVCERDASGQCGWRETPELKACLGGGGEPAEPAPCRPAGCSGQICSDRDDLVSTCEWREEYACYQRLGICERDASGRCGWRETPELKACLGGGGEPTDPAPCRPTGCSSEICSDRDVASDCVYREEYACYQRLGVCERDASGQCGWRETPELKACLESSSTPERTPVSNRCVRNSGDPCTTDADCAVGGCGGDLCYNPAFGSGVSTCDCTGNDFACGCVNGTCSFWQ